MQITKHAALTASCKTDKPKSAGTACFGNSIGPCSERPCGVFLFFFGCVCFLFVFFVRLIRGCTYQLSVFLTLSCSEHEEWVVIDSATRRKKKETLSMRHVCSFCTVWLLLFVRGGLLFFLLSLSLSLIPLHRCTVVTHTTTSLCLVFLLLVSVV
jgi:hypothetical protein